MATTYKWEIRKNLNDVQRAKLQEMEQLIERSKTILGEIQMQVMSLESKRFEQAEHVQDLGRKYVDQVNEFAKAHGIDTSTSPRTRNHRFDEAM